MVSHGSRSDEGTPQTPPSASTLSRLPRQVKQVVPRAWNLLPGKTGWDWISQGIYGYSNSPAYRSPLMSMPLSAAVLSGRWSPSGAWTVVTPVSSIFQTLLPEKDWRSYTVCKFWKKCPTVWMLKLVALATLVAWGFRIERDLFLFRKPKPVPTCHLGLLPRLWELEVEVNCTLECKFPDLRKKPKKNSK